MANETYWLVNYKLPYSGDLNIQNAMPSELSKDFTPQNFDDECDFDGPNFQISESNSIILFATICWNTRFYFVYGSKDHVETQGFNLYPVHVLSESGTYTF